MKQERKISAEQRVENLIEKYKSLGMSTELAVRCSCVCINEIVDEISEEDIRRNFSEFLYYTEIVHLLRSKLKDFED